VNCLHRSARGGWYFLVVPLLLYSVTVARDIGLPDSAIIIDAMRTPVLSSSAVNHTLNNLFGFVVNLLPIRNIALKSHLVSVVYGTVAVGLFHVLLLNLRVSRPVAGLCAGILMVSHSMWWHSTQVENYALSAVFLVACLLLVVKDSWRGEDRPCRRHVCGLFFLAGLALLNHLQNGALSVAAVVYLVATRGRWKGQARHLLPAAVAAYALGLAPFALVFAKDWACSGDGGATVGALTGGAFRQFMFSGHPVPALKQFGDWVVMQFPSPFLAFLPVGAVVLARRPKVKGLAAFVGTVLTVNTVFFMGYRTWDQFSFYLLSFVCLAFLGAVGVDYCVRHAPAWGRGGLWLLLAASLALPPMVYANIPRWAAAPEGYWSRRYHAASLAYRGRYDLVGLYTDPLRHDRGTVAQWIRQLMERLPPGALVIDDVSGYYQIEYFRKYYGQRPDLGLLLLQPLGMEGWGAGLDEIVETGCLTTNRLFIVATNGPCERVVAAFKREGKVPVLFPLSAECWLYELVDAGPR
jgi:hypothetical protein